MATKKKVEEKEEMQDQVQEETKSTEEEGEKLSDVMYGENGEELLFPSGPSIAKVEEWKSQFNDEVYMTEFDEETFLWRPLKRKEYKDVLKTKEADQFYREERICERVILFPEGYNFMDMTHGKAGIPTILSELVMEKSGFQYKTAAMRL